VNVNRIHVVINPAAGQKAPVLHTLNAVFQGHVAWETSVTHQAGDGERQARAAAEAGADLVAAYGGDGTILEVACGLHGTGVPLAILPGGTSNMLSVDLGIPRRLSAAAALILSEDAVVRALDMGDAHGKLFFHLGVGLEGEMIQRADRKAKETSGVLAYFLSALQTLRDEAPVRYRLTLDGQTVEAEGINCMITNYGRLGVAGLTLSHQIVMTDGLLDVIVIAHADLRAFITAAASAVVSRDFAQSLQQWQAHEVSLETDTPQTITRDGELLERSAAVTAHVVPGAVRILVPK
jgi:diacylglycerol kinase (ATP)